MLTVVAVELVTNYMEHGLGTQRGMQVLVNPNAK